MLPPLTFGWCGAGHSYLGYCGPMPCHAEDTACWGACHIPNRPLPVYLIDDVGTEGGPVSYSDDQDSLESLVRHLLPTPAVSPPNVSPIPSEHQQFIQRLMGNEFFCGRCYRSVLILRTWRFCSVRFSGDGPSTAGGGLP